MAKKDKDNGKDKKKKKKSGEPAAARDMVPVVYARNATEAELYKQLLTSNDIPAVIEDDAGETTIGMPASIVGQGVPILVPDEMLSEASEIIAEHEDTAEDEELDEYEDIEDDADEDLDEDEELDEDEDIDEEDEEKFDEDLDDDDMDDLDEVDEDEDER